MNSWWQLNVPPGNLLGTYFINNNLGSSLGRNGVEKYNNKIDLPK